MVLYIIIGIITIVLVLTLIVLIQCLKLKDLNQTISLAQEKLMIALTTKKDLLNKLKEETKNKDLIKLMNIEDNLNIFELEKILYDVRWQLNKLIEENRLKIKKENKIVMTDLLKIEEEIEGLKDYYNYKALSYNEIYYKKGLHFIYNIFKYEQKKTFLLRKIDDYEILKD